MISLRTYEPRPKMIWTGLLFRYVTSRITNSGLLARQSNNRPPKSCTPVRNSCVIRESVGRSRWKKVAEGKVAFKGRNRHLFLWEKVAKASDVLRALSAICRFADETFVRTLRSTRPDEQTTVDICHQMLRLPTRTKHRRFLR